ncbi:hypothetical protein [Massilia sp. Leaf139]|uniref:hypothetical protein n=1 Tax=Massilia sp. Leaf139 TaxID=1736272 RepID=UPI0006FA0908|nr:hypothetical protein [Massilia sp. Leaf139]KQQ86444.1 hypothetical protein ASF77_20965 [Massilia sp. Leaf139]
MTTLQYAISDQVGQVLGFAEEERMPALPDGLVAHVMVERVPSFPEPPWPTSTLHVANNELYWVETAPLEQAKELAIARTYVDVDAVYEAAIGRRGTEYTRAEDAARVYLAADPKPAVVSGYITGHALTNPTGQVQSEAWAAQQIVERADAFRWAELQMRNVRFARQADMRAAITPEDLATAVGQWNDFITWLRSTLGL